MDTPTKRVDNFGTYLNTVARPRMNVNIQADVAPMKILEALYQNSTATQIVDLAAKSGMSISQTVLALSSLRNANLVSSETGNDDAISLTPSGRTIADISIPNLSTNFGMSKP